MARDPNPHLGIGQARHSCLGANLARLALREERLARFVRFALAGPATSTRDNRLLGPATLPMRLVRAGSPR